nr:class II aldolase/adducin family protein [Methylobacterium sp. E-025]
MALDSDPLAGSLRRTRSDRLESLTERLLPEARSRFGCLFMKHHGVMVLGPIIAEAWDDLYDLERAAEVQTLALSTGRQVIPVDPAIAEATARQMRAGDPESARLPLSAIRRILDREEPAYRD